MYKYTFEFPSANWKQSDVYSKFSEFFGNHKDYISSTSSVKETKDGWKFVFHFVNFDDARTVVESIYGIDGNKKVNEEVKKIDFYEVM